MKKPNDRSHHRAIEALKAAVENPGPSRAMSEKRKFLLENFETIQQARYRKPRPLSYARIAKIMSQNGYKVSAQLVAAVCNEHEHTRLEGGLKALDGAATMLDKNTTKLDGAAMKLDGAATKLDGVAGTLAGASKSCRPRQKRAKL